MIWERERRWERDGEERRQQAEGAVGSRQLEQQQRAYGELGLKPGREG